jgi:hypothetical protein
MFSWLWLICLVLVLSNRLNRPCLTLWFCGLELVRFLTLVLSVWLADLRSIDLVLSACLAKFPPISTGTVLQPHPTTAMAIATRATAMGSHAQATTLMPDALDATVTEESEDQWAHAAIRSGRTQSVASPCGWG